MKSWKTTVAGVLTALLLAFGEINALMGGEAIKVQNDQGEVVTVSDDKFDITVLLAAGTLAWGLIASRDDNVSSEGVKASKNVR
jgi:hypothetical protein